MWAGEAPLLFFFLYRADLFSFCGCHQIVSYSSVMMRFGFLCDLMGDGSMRTLKRFLFSFFWVSLAACGGGDDGEWDFPVVYREDDAVLMVDGRAYHRRTTEEIGVVFLPEGNAVPGLLSVWTKSGVEKDAVIAHFQRYGLGYNYLDCQLISNEHRCSIGQIAVPPDWGDQWRRAMADWSWVERADFERVDFED
jgi:hypothetical protein